MIFPLWVGGRYRDKTGMKVSHFSFFFIMDVQKYITILNFMSQRTLSIKAYSDWWSYFRIAKDTFNKMKKLQYLNIAYNDMTKIPHGFLCPWYYHNNIESTGVFGCEEKEAAKSVVGLNTIQNPWHCDCAFQEFIENFSCQIGKSPCIEYDIVMILNFQLRIEKMCHAIFML